MAPSRGKAKARAGGSAGTATATNRRSTRRAQPKDVIPDVFDDMLAEAAVTEPVEESSRPLKRRRILREVSIPVYNESSYDKGKRPAASPPSAGTARPTQAVNVATSPARALQTVETSEDEEESDFGFEDVDLEQHASTSQAAAEEDGIADVSISLDSNTTPKGQAKARRKPATLVEKAHRLLVHKAHVLCLLGHCIYLNSWCNNEVVHRHLEPLLSERMRNSLHPKASDSQFVRNRSFMDGLQQACEAFTDQFQVTAPGMRRAQWAGEGDQNAAQTDTEPMDRADFIKAAKRLQGSQDTGNQLFCAMLRSVGIEARLVCSLQPLPFTSTPAKISTPLRKKPFKPTVLAIASDTDPDKSEASASDASVLSSRSIGKVPSIRRRLGQPSFASPSVPKPPPTQKKKHPIRKLAYPIFWTEAFNPAHQKWIPLDPIVTNTLNKPAKLEPPSSYPHNQLSYVLAFEADGVAKDVTRRYAKAFNAKTRRQRVEATANGASWLKRALRIFRRRAGAVLDRDQVEDAELAQREAGEGFPGNVQDFRRHPWYALERHLTRQEVLHPRREVGKVNAGTAARPRMEAVFRRRDVLVCRSAAKWYRLGREVRAGEQALKHVVARSPRRAKSPARREDEDDEDGPEGREELTPLYAPFQTRLYVPPPALPGRRLPRNAFGNLDVYVPSMVPAGAAHIRHPLAREAARVLGIECVDAVVGFSFRGRQGTAVVEGVVVGEGFAEAVRGVIGGIEDGRVEEVSVGRSLRALRGWVRFLRGLRIGERVRGYGGKGGGGEGKGKGRAGDGEGEGEGGDEAGGFVVADDEAEEDEERDALPTAGRFSIGELVATAKSGKAGKAAKAGEGAKAVEVAQETKRVARKKRRVVVVSGSESGSRSESEGEREYFNEGTHVPRGKEVDDLGGLARSEGEYNADEGGGFMPADDGGGGGGGGAFPPDDPGRDDEGGGGFVLDDKDGADGVEGGFLPDAAESSRAGEDGGGVGCARTVSAADEDASFAETHASLVLQTAAVEHGEASRHEVRRGDDVVCSGLGEGEDGLACAAAVAYPGNALASEGDMNDVGDGVARELAPSAGGVGRLAHGGDGADGYDRVVEEESDRGSLMSQDPDDEDAEPDWLESD
ncbi:hypothetical protein LTR08_002084 [Meristemomyces frigidus]|nr:hypothetical protein LTR08_002084 [Meristemomyces frigidus]